MPKKAVQKAGGDGEEAPAQRAEAAAPAAEEQKVHKPDKNERERLKKEKAGAAPAGEEAKPHKPDQAERKRKREERAGASAAAAGAEGGGGGEEKAGGNKGAKRAKPDPPGTVYPILVRGLGGVSIVDLQDLFSECGTIKHVRITGQGKAIIDFETRVAAATAVKLDGSDVDGNKIRVATLMPTLSPEAEAAQKPEAVPVDEEGYTYTVIVNSIPAGTTKEECWLA
ncbi:hypothetical protein T484DRAFT_1781590 [Baffinella frigidus]|nr:hypothetical protein T484DRAFT_1781590 [Cryptophyta sp. CCMP2293]